MNRWTGFALFLAMAALFLIANRTAYRGYFQDDELDNIGWAPGVRAADYFTGLITPVYSTGNFRPVGHLFFRVMSRRFGLDFPKYVIPIHLLHFLNVWLVWLVLRRLGCAPLGASTGALFFAFHMAVFDVYWKPMYVFDLLCAAFCLASLLLWMERRWLLSFAAFWLAYKSKEMAVMLPAVLACYELWAGKRRWKPLLPFVLVSLSFGLQGVLMNPNHDNDYAFRFTPEAVAAGATFYAGKLFLIPWAGFGLLLLPFISRYRRVWLGLATVLLFFVPLVFLPGRLFSAYWYVPLIGVAMIAGTLGETRYGWLAAVFFLVWIPWNYEVLREKRAETLRLDAEYRSYVAQLQASAGRRLDIPLYFYSGLPPAFHWWGVEGALKWLAPKQNVKLYSATDPTAETLLGSPTSAALTWIERERKLWIVAHEPKQADAPYVAMDPTTPYWQLTGGWYALENGYRWIAPHATARLVRTPNATTFEVAFNVDAQLLRTLGHSDCSVRLNGVPVGTAHFTEPGVGTVRWPLPPGQTGPVDVEFEVQPAYRSPNGDQRALGIAIFGFGFS